MTRPGTFPEVPSPNCEETPRNLAALDPHMGEDQAACNTPGGGGKALETSGSCPTRGRWDQGDTEVYSRLSHHPSLIWGGGGEAPAWLTEEKPDCSGLNLD